VSKELFIHADSLEVVIALLEDKQLVELHKEKGKNEFAVGDVYLGRVKKIMPGLNAAFIDVGFEKDAFLHYLDLGPQVKSLIKYTRQALSNQPTRQLDNFVLENDIEKNGKLSEILKPNQDILVQIAKEPISTKGPRVSSEISFAGRFIVLVPFSNRISVSQKIKSVDERNRLKRLIQSIKPNNFGVIVRTVAENKMVADLVTDMNTLVEKWYSSMSRLQPAKSPQKVISELNRTSAVIRDVLNESFNNIYVDDSLLYEEIKAYIKTIANDKQDIVKLHKNHEPIFEHFGIEKQIKSLFGKTVTTKSGVYLIIEHTEAMHVIDVNSGHRTSSDKNQETNASEVNLEAAKEIARQLRLRDMGGIIVVDFIDMHEITNRRKLYKTLAEEMTKDKAKHNILPPSKFGLVQITRQRVRPITDIEVIERCPVCDGSGEIKSSIILSDEIENNIAYLINEQNEKEFTLAANPYIYAFLTKGLISIQVKWFFKFKKWIKVKSVNSFHLLEYRFFNKNNDEIRV